MQLKLAKFDEVSPIMLRIMLDTNGHDYFAERSDFGSLVEGAIIRGQIELVRTSVQETELSRINNEAKRRAALSISGRKVATYGFIPGWAVPGEARPADGGSTVKLCAIQNGNPKHAADALIAATAEMEVDVLVTGDKRLNAPSSWTGHPLASLEMSGS